MFMTTHTHKKCFWNFSLKISIVVILLTTWHNQVSLPLKLKAIPFSCNHKSFQGSLLNAFLVFLESVLIFDSNKNVEDVISFTHRNHSFCLEFRREGNYLAKSEETRLTRKQFTRWALSILCCNLCNYIFYQ